MKINVYIVLILICFLQVSCEDFIQLDDPDHILGSATVFNNDETAKAAVVGIYNQLSLSAFSNGSQSSITVLAELSADNLKSSFSNPTLLQFEENEIFKENMSNLDLWSSAYNIVYMTNAVMEGLNKSQGVSEDIKEKLLGEVKFIRAFTYFYIVNLYGDVPLVMTSDFRDHVLARRINFSEVYNQIIEDLEYSIQALDSSVDNQERLRVNHYTAKALLARVHLYLHNWELAEGLSNDVISNQNYELLENLDAVFLANSKEAIWQISPLGRGTTTSHTNEGGVFIMVNNIASVSLTEDLLASFDSTDIRLENWVGIYETANDRYFYPYKYKIKNATGDYSEYSTVLRLAEQYLIRAESRARQGKLDLAISDLNVIRERANLKIINTNNPELNQANLLVLIMDERRRELFAEWGHRWLDLKRYKAATDILSSKKPLWQPTDVLYPIPEDEIRKNPNLTQNQGY